MRLRENNKVTRILFPLLLSLASPALAGLSDPDPLFAKVRFEEWTAGKGQPPFKWNVHAEPVTLSSHLRWVSKIVVEIDGAEMESRRGKGALFVMFQLEDSAGHTYQDHGVLDLAKVQPGVKGQIINYTESVFVLPGSYSMSIGVFDTNTRDHWLKRETLKIPNDKNDPLPWAWRYLPPIEIVPHDESPDSWYLPTVTSRLNLPVATRHPLKIEILVNLTPSERVTDSQRILDRNLGVLLPTMKALSQMDLKSATLSIETVDLTRQKVTFRQESVKPLEGSPLNWLKMRDALNTNQTGTIDVKSLGDRERSAQFFIAEVAKRVKTTDVLIILSGSVRFEQGVNLEPIHYEGTPDCQVFFLRYHPPALHTIVQPQQSPLLISRRAPVARRGPVNVIIPPIVDQLEPTLKPLRHQLFDTGTPEEMRKAIADLLAGISLI
jgi:hypothetical protein